MLAGNVPTDDIVDADLSNGFTASTWGISAGATGSIDFRASFSPILGDTSYVFDTNMASCSLPDAGSSFYLSCFIISFSPPEIILGGEAFFGADERSIVEWRGSIGFAMVCWTTGTKRFARRVGVIDSATVGLTDFIMFRSRSVSPSLEPKLFAVSECSSSISFGSWLVSSCFSSSLVKFSVSTVSVRLWVGSNGGNVYLAANASFAIWKELKVNLLAASRAVHHVACLLYARCIFLAAWWRRKDSISSSDGPIYVSSIIHSSSTGVSSSFSTGASSSCTGGSMIITSSYS